MLAKRIASMIPSGNAMLTTRITTVITPTRNPEDPPAGIRDACGDRVGGHEDHPKREAAKHQVPVPRHRKHRIGVGAEAH